MIHVLNHVAIREPNSMVSIYTSTVPSSLDQELIELELDRELAFECA
jgi:hypothetical protein